MRAATLLLGEDIPAAWDNWDIDADQAAKMEGSRHIGAPRGGGGGPLHCGYADV